ncbi:hypothetical protein [Thermogutta sp.]|uniref:hypothetical protein n=1 Tax=Thermogutta sp. TaxID=1962930 RepID=UPI00321F9CCD
MDDTVRQWDPDSRELYILEGRIAKASYVAFSPDGSVLAYGSWDHIVWPGTPPRGRRCIP